MIYREDGKARTKGRKRWLAYAAAVLVAIAVPAYWWLFVESAPASPGPYSLDLAALRKLAKLTEGDKPISIRVETVAHLSAPSTFVTAGSGWGKVDLPVSAYELTFKNHSIVIDSGVSMAIGRSMGVTSFDAASFARVSKALHAASLILLTHEHPDHIGGLLAQPGLSDLLARTHLTQEQVDVLKAHLNEDQFGGLRLDPKLFDRQRALRYDRYLAIAPGVVLIKSPGHTPGSQMVYVRRADGAELLIVGDVAWRIANIETGKERARAITWMIGENRAEVRQELAGLRNLHRAAPGLQMLPGHDDIALGALKRSGMIEQGF